MHHKLVMTVMIASLACAAIPALAESPDYVHTTLTGDWDGARTRMSDLGIDLNLYYTGDFAYNLTGGDRHSGAYASEFDFDGAFDLEKLVGWKGGSFHTEVANFHGQLLDAKVNLGSLMDTQEIYDGHGTYLSNFYLEQSLWNGLVDIKYGRMDFNASFYPTFANLNFQGLSFYGPQPGLMVPDLVDWPTSAIGEVITIKPSEAWDFKVGNFAVQPNNFVPNDLKVQNRGHRVGNMTVGELDFFTTLAGGSKDAPLSGTWALGGWHNTAPKPDLFLDINGLPQALTGATPLMRGSTSGVYVTGQQQVTRNAAGGGLTLFMNLVQADSEVDFIDQMSSVGMLYAAPFASRPNDIVGVVLGRNHVSSRVADANRIINASSFVAVPVPSSEYLLELNYTASLYRGITLMPNLQYVRHPGGTKANRDYTVLGAQLIVSF
ncbi:MAG: carbohydrate porin [Rhodanobacter sp.]|nr:MAG: carbohydrate porin [Rhodanobacter sp.]TAM39572.1 MAG: carbohydrate porin [Rhodanobacter sp.]